MNLPFQSRREFLATATLASAAALPGCTTTSPASAGIIDTHTHFYDPTRPEGVPWPPKNDAVLYRPVLPEEFKRIALPLGVAGTVVVEASSRVEDNQWVLDLAAREKVLFGLVGHLKPGRSGFAEDLNRFAKNRLFRGIRSGGWDVKLTRDDAFIRDLRQLADRDLALDVLIGPDQLPLVAQLAATIPSLRIVIDHCANVRIDGQAPPAAWRDGILACGARANVFMKVSGLVEGTGRTDGTAPTDLKFYRPTLDVIWNAFGEDRVVFGSNWPVSARFASYATVLRIVQDYFEAKGRASAKKYFSGNAHRVYKVRVRE